MYLEMLSGQYYFLFFVVETNAKVTVSLNDLAVFASILTR